MFKVGEYSEDAAKIIAGYLKDAGFKVDVRSLVVTKMEVTLSLQCKLSEMKARNKFTEEHERFLAATKASAEKASTQDEFRINFIEAIFPDWNEKKGSFIQNAESIKVVDEEAIKEIGKHIEKYYSALCFAEDIQDLNNIALGIPVGSLFDDPIISIPVKHSEFDPDDPMYREKVDVDMIKVYEI